MKSESCEIDVQGEALKYLQTTGRNLKAQYQNEFKEAQLTSQYKSQLDYQSQQSPSKRKIQCLSPQIQNSAKKSLNSLSLYSPNVQNSHLHHSTTSSQHDQFEHHSQNLDTRSKNKFIQFANQDDHNSFHLHPNICDYQEQKSYISNSDIQNQYLDFNHNMVNDEIQFQNEKESSQLCIQEETKSFFSNIQSQDSKDKTITEKCKDQNSNQFCILKLKQCSFLVNEDQEQEVQSKQKQNQNAYRRGLTFNKKQKASISSSDINSFSNNKQKISSSKGGSNKQFRSTSKQSGSMSNNYNSEHESFSEQMQATQSNSPDSLRYCRQTALQMEEQNYSNSIYSSQTLQNKAQNQQHKPALPKNAMRALSIKLCQLFKSQEDSLNEEEIANRKYSQQQPECLNNIQYEEQSYATKGYQTPNCQEIYQNVNNNQNEICYSNRQFDEDIEYFFKGQSPISSQLSENRPMQQYQQVGSSRTAYQIGENRNLLIGCSNSNYSQNEQNSFDYQSPCDISSPEMHGYVREQTLDHIFGGQQHSQKFLGLKDNKSLFAKNHMTSKSAQKQLQYSQSSGLKLRGYFNNGNEDQSTDHRQIQHSDSKKFKVLRQNLLSLVNDLDNNNSPVQINSRLGNVKQESVNTHSYEKVQTFKIHLKSTQIQ
eukprot:403364623